MRNAFGFERLADICDLAQGSGRQVLHPSVFFSGRHTSPLYAALPKSGGESNTLVSSGERLAKASLRPASCFISLMLDSATTKPAVSLAGFPERAALRYLASIYASRIEDSWNTKKQPEIRRA